MSSSIDLKLQAKILKMLERETVTPVREIRTVIYYVTERTICRYLARMAAEGIVKRHGKLGDQNGGWLRV
jgi:DeoR/GlpR family transcriptional regulator of sugar metabolism